MRAPAGLVVAVLLGACGADDGGDRPTSPGAAVVERPIDGDTVDVRLKGETERVRLIGIDTPESVAHGRPVECFGMEAKDRLAALLPAGTAVRLERDVEARDRYGRLLAYVYRSSDGVHVNLLLVEEGYAESRAFQPNVAHQPALDRAESDARSAHRGLWPACGGTDAPAG